MFRIPRITFFLLMALLLAACGSRTQPKPASLLIGTFSRAIDYSPFYVAQNYNWFQEHPALKDIKVEYKEFNDRTAIASAFDAGELHAIFCAEPPAIICRAQGNDIRIAGISCTLQQEIVVRRDLPVNSALDLKGKKIAVLQGTSSHYGLLRTLRMAKLTPTDVDIVYMPPDQAQTAFESGRIDAWAVWPPFIEQEQVSGKGRVLAGGDAVIQSIMALPASDIKNFPDVAKALVEVLNRSKSWIRSHPEESQTIVAKRLGLEIAVVKAAWGKHDWDSHLTDGVVKDISDKAVFLADQQALRQPIDVGRDLMFTSYDRQ